MNTEPTSFGDYIKRVREEEGLSLMAVSKRSGGSKVGISDGHLSRIENGFVLGTALKPNTIRAIARGLGRPVAEVEAAAYGEPLKEADAGELQLLTFFRSLPKTYQDDLLKIARVFHAEHGVKPARELKIDKYVETKRQVA